MRNTLGVEDRQTDRQTQQKLSPETEEETHDRQGRTQRRGEGEQQEAGEGKVVQGHPDRLGDVTA